MKTHEEMFQFYKSDLLKQARKTNKGDRFFNGTIPPLTGWTRYCTIEYMCSFAKLDSIRMAAEIAREGIKIYFDSYAITEEENRRKERAVLKEIRRQNGEAVS